MPQPNSHSPAGHAMKINPYESPREIQNPNRTDVCISDLAEFIAGIALLLLLALAISVGSVTLISIVTHFRHSGVGAGFPYICFAASVFSILGGLYVFCRVLLSMKGT
jgi:hypothetical protein